MSEQWTEEFDVVVVGSGGGAMAGAYLAAQAGLSTVVVEKTEKLGGTSAYSGGACWLPGSQVQQRAGIPDSVESAREYLRSLIGNSEVDRQEAFLETAPGLVARLEEDPALSFAFQAFPDYFDRPGRVPGGRSIIPDPIPQAELGDLITLVRPGVEHDRVSQGHGDGPLTGGRALIGRLLIAYDGTGRGTVRTRTTVDELVVEDGKVIGIVARTYDGDVRIRARRGVLLASGGFERNAEERSRHGVPGDAAWAMAPAGTNTGEPLRAAVAIGADTSLMNDAWWCPGLMMPDGGAAFTLGFSGGLIVDSHGQRYANESLPYDQMGRLMAADAARIPSFIIFDSRNDGQLPAIAQPWPIAEPHLEAGTWVAADTLEELAARIGTPEDALVASVERFNRFAQNDRDADFGRGLDEFDRFFGGLTPVDKAPFYAAKLVLADLGTKGGLVTDPAARVLRADGSPIPGLYAVGNTSASMTGPVYPGPGIPLGTAMVFAARAVADLVASDIVEASATD